MQRKRFFVVAGERRRKKEQRMGGKRESLLPGAYVLSQGTKGMQEKAKSLEEGENRSHQDFPGQFDGVGGRALYHQGRSIWSTLHFSFSKRKMLLFIF